MADYLFEGKLENQVHDIGEADIEQLHRISLRDAREGQSITESSYRNETYQRGDNWQMGFFRDVLERDSMTSGFQMQYPHGKVIEQSLRRHFFRGENKIYDSCEPSLHRALENFSTEDQKELYRLVADMRIAEFSFFLNKFDHVKNWNCSDVLYDTLAQHYGLKTDWLDITTDFDVAMFFATCRYENGKWYPLTKNETELDEKSQYGMIFHMPSWQNSSRFSFDLQLYAASTSGTPIKFERSPQNVIFPIGFQPFMRCHMQNGYGIYMRGKRPLQNDFAFEKLRFRHSEKLSNKYYEMMEGGEKIYPHEGLTKAQFIIDEIANANVFSEAAFRYALYRSHKYPVSEEERCRADLENFIVDGKNITIQKEHPWKISSGRRRKIDSMYQNFSVEAWYGIQLRTRIGTSAPSMYRPWMLPESSDELGTLDFEPFVCTTDCDNIFCRDLVRILDAVMKAKMSDF